MTRNHDSKMEVILFFASNKKSALQIFKTLKSTKHTTFVLEIDELHVSWLAKQKLFFMS